MPVKRISKEEKKYGYFITCTVIEWIAIFTSEKYFQVLQESLRFYQQEYNLRIYAYVFMTNHMHILFRCSDAIAFIRDFKKFTTFKIRKLLQKDKRKYIKKLIKNSYSKGKGRSFQIWQSTNMPKKIISEEFLFQKMKYIHSNPVKKGYVRSAEDWYYSSAGWYYGKQDNPIIIDNVHE